MGVDVMGVDVMNELTQQSTLVLPTNFQVLLRMLTTFLRILLSKPLKILVQDFLIMV